MQLGIGLLDKRGSYGSGVKTLSLWAGKLTVWVQDSSVAQWGWAPVPWSSSCPLSSSKSTPIWEYLSSAMSTSRPGISSSQAPKLLPISVVPLHLILLNYFLPTASPRGSPPSPFRNSWPISSWLSLPRRWLVIAQLLCRHVHQS